MSRLLTILLPAGALIATTAVAAPGIEGTWTNPARDVNVRIARCGRTQCGRVTAASPYARKRAASAGTQSLVGTEVISNIEQTGPDSWRADIFVPDQNVHSSGDISLLRRDEMSVRGCMVGGLICKEQNWTRVAAPAQRPRVRHGTSP